MSTTEVFISNVAAAVTGGLILAIIESKKNHLKALLSNLKFSIKIFLASLSNETKTLLLSQSFISVFNPVSKFIMGWTVRLSQAICGVIIVIGWLLHTNPYHTFLLGISIVVAVEVPYRMLMSDLKRVDY